MFQTLHEISKNLKKKKKKFTKGKISLVKGKHIVKVVDQPLIKLVGRLKDKSSKIIYIYRK